MHLPTQGFCINFKFQKSKNICSWADYIFGPNYSTAAILGKDKKNFSFRSLRTYALGQTIFSARTTPQQPFSVKIKKNFLVPLLSSGCSKKRRFPLRQLGLFQKKKVPSPFVRVVPKGRFPLRQLEFFQKEGSFSVY